MITAIIGVLALIWLGMAIACYRFLKKQIEGRLKNVFRPESGIREEYKPFERTDFTDWELSRIYRNCFLIFPLKFLLLLSWASTGAAFVYIIVGIEKVLRKPYIPLLRDLFKFYMNVFVGTSLHFLCQVEERDVNKKTQQNPIVISNHISWWEIVYFVTTRWPIAFLAKDAVKNWPLVGTIAKFGGSIFIKRQNSADRQTTLNLIKQRCAKIKEGDSIRNPPLLIFPEGTTTNGNYLIKFKKGAFECLQPVQISVLNYTSPRWNVSMDAMGELTNILLFLCHSPRLQINNIYNVSPRSESAQQFMQDCLKLMSKTGLQRQSSPAGFRHKREYQQYLDPKKSS